ncbi:unnamed protein product [Ectocarpus fasciculatus]
MYRPFSRALICPLHQIPSEALVYRSTRYGHQQATDKHRHTEGSHHALPLELSRGSRLIYNPRHPDWSLLRTLETHVLLPSLRACSSPHPSSRAPLPSLIGPNNSHALTLQMYIFSLSTLHTASH